MSDRYVQLLLVNLILAVLIVTVVFGGPVFPAVCGAAAAGGAMILRHRAAKRGAKVAPRLSEVGERVRRYRSARGW